MEQLRVARFGAAPTAVRQAVRTLHPGYFGMVMATAILSIGLHGRGVPAVSTTLMWLAGIAYLLLVLLHGWRIVAFGEETRHDLADPVRGFTFFTFVAGSAVLGTRLALAGHLGMAAALAVVVGVAWLVLGYLVPWAVVLGSTERPVVAGANGTWFIWVVATQSVAVLATALEPAVGTGRRELALLALVCWSVGVFLYAAVGLLTALRLVLYRVRPADLGPPYWVTMGATAITALAGARILGLTGTPALAATRDLVAGVSTVFWAFGTWLIPPLLAAAWWRHVGHRIPLRYEPAWWCVIFPLAMYGLASVTLGRAEHLPLLETVGRYESWVALTAWTTAFVAMSAHLAHEMLHQTGGPEPRQ